MNYMDGKYAEAQRMLELLKSKRREQRRKRLEELVKHGFFVVLLLLILVGGGYLTYTNHDKIIAFVDTKTGVNLAELFAKKTPVIVSSDTCKDLNIETLPDSQFKVIPTPKVGDCYTISEDQRGNWKKVVDGEADRFAQYISDKSNSNMDISTIIERLKESLSTGILDLRTSQVQDLSFEPTQTPLPTEILATSTREATSTPTKTPTPQVIVIPWPEKERGYTLEELARVMTEHNIQTVSGENHSTSPQDRARWALYYSVSDGVEDYVVFKNLESTLPVSCSSGNFITISLVEVDNPAAMKMTIGIETTYEIFFVCK